MFFYTRSDRKYIGIKDDVIRIEIELANEQVIAAFADVLASLQIVCLTIFIESHYHHGGTILLAQFSLSEKFFFSGFKAD